MSQRATVEVVGAKELRRTLKGLGDDLADLSATHQQIAELIGEEAARRVPNTTGRGTGRLAASMRPSKAKTEAAVRFGSARVPYANAQHWGTGARPGLRGPHNIAATHFASSAASDLEETWVPIYEDAVDGMLAKVKGA